MAWTKKFRRISPHLRKRFIIILVLIFFAAVIMNLDITDSIWLGDNTSEPQIDERLSLEFLRDDMTDCLTNSIQDVTEEDLTLFSKDMEFDPTIFSVLTSFNNLLTYFGVKAVIIEPSVLYCMLIPKYQALLLKRHFNISNSFRKNNILTYGIMEYDVPTLQEEGSINKFTMIDFHPYFVQHPLEDWMPAQNVRHKFETFPSHIFYKHSLFTIHVVVFHGRSSYYWHAALSIDNHPKIPPKEELKFVNHDGAYEKFAIVPLESKMLPLADFYVPSNPHYFLFEMMSSKFLDCDLSRAAYIHSTDYPNSHDGMSKERFNRRTRIVLRELKNIFHPLLMNIWIWSGTMLGWYRQCDIIPYTTDVDFAAWASEVEDVDGILKSFLSNDHINIIYRMGVLEEGLELQLDCHSLHTDVFFTYQIRNGTWYSGHSPKLGYYFRYFMPNFTLCSAELLGEKVQVPCETEKVIAAEYGPNWRIPADTWSYETSPKNRGPNIYWDKERLKDAYNAY